MEATKKSVEVSSSFVGKEQLASFASGCIARAIEYPFDTVKTKMQAMMKRRAARQQKQQQKTAAASSSKCNASGNTKIPIMKNNGTLPTWYRFQNFFWPSSSSTTTPSSIKATTSTKNNTLMKFVSFSSLWNTTTNKKKPNGSTSTAATPVTATTNAMKKSPSYQCATRIFKKDGVRGFYRGVAGPMIGSAGEVSAAFTAYNSTLEFLDYLFPQKQHEQGKNVVNFSAATNNNTPNEPSMRNVLIAGAVAGVGTASILTPIELVKCRMQTTKSYKSSWDCIKKILKASTPSSTGASSTTSAQQQQASLSPSRCRTLQNTLTGGVRTLYTGFGATLAREMFGNAAWFGTYEFTLRTFFAKKADSANVNHPYAWYATPLAGSCAGLLYVTAFYPADVVKTLIQTDKKFSKMSLRQGISHVYKTSGLKGLYFGVGISAARAIPSNAAVFTIYEAVVAS